MNGNIYIYIAWPLLVKHSAFVVVMIDWFAQL
jgi:hypothetical protein